MTGGVDAGDLERKLGFSTADQRGQCAAYVAVPDERELFQLVDLDDGTRSRGGYARIAGHQKSIFSMSESSSDCNAARLRSSSDCRSRRAAIWLS